jgi:hypothetical protein
MLLNYLKKMVGSQHGSKAAIFIIKKNCDGAKMMNIPKEVSHQMTTHLYRSLK